MEMDKGLTGKMLSLPETLNAFAESTLKRMHHFYNNKTFNKIFFKEIGL